MEKLWGINNQEKKEYGLYNKNISVYSAWGSKSFQQDSFAFASHPKYKDVHVIAVADGVGATKNGGFASHIFCFEILKWFIKENMNVNFKLIQESFNDYIEKVNRKIRKEAKDGQTTATGAIILPDETLVFNIGDSRGYIVSGNDFFQATNDKSHVYELLNEGAIATPELTRFHLESNFVTNTLGSNELQSVDYYFYPTSSFDRVAVVTDGVCDCLSADQIKKIITNYDDPNVAKTLVDRALKTTSCLTEELKSLIAPQDRGSYYDIIPGAIDNTTAVVYTKNKRTK